MNAPHKIPDEWLLSYAAGALNQGRSLLVASHVACHEDLQEAVADAEAIGGSMIESMPMTDVDNAVLENLLDRLGDQNVASPEPVKPVRNGHLPQPLLDYIDCDVNSLEWKFVAPGMKQANLWQGPGNQRLWMLRARGGMSLPQHGHMGDEWALIVKGSYQTEFGRYDAGALDMADDEIVHKPVIDEGEECICLVFSEGPIQLKGLFGRLLQPLVNV